MIVLVTGESDSILSYLMESRGYINDSIQDPHYISNQLILEGYNSSPVLGLTIPEMLILQSTLLAMNNLDIIVDFVINFINIDIIYLGLM